MPLLASFVAITVSVVAAVVPALELPGHVGADKPPFPAPPGYVLPWPGGELHSVTQGEETSLTHNGAAAYAFDFDLTYDTVVAARAGKVTMVRQDSNVGGCSASFSGSANYVLVDHGDGTSALYLHLAQNSVVVHVGDVVDRGEALAISGETGLTCADNDSGPGPHLHFQVERTEEGRYFTQSLPIAFDDISKNDGVPSEGETYMSGNYGRGKPQKIKLTPHRVEREFNPVARPANPALFEADPLPAPTATPPPADTQQAPAASPDHPDEAAPPTPDVPTLTAEASRTPRPTRTPVITPSDTPEPPPSDTPIPAATPAPKTAVPSNTSAAQISSTGSPAETASPPIPGASPTPP